MPRRGPDGGIDMNLVALRANRLGVLLRGRLARVGALTWLLAVVQGAVILGGSFGSAPWYAVLGEVLSAELSLLLLADLVLLTMGRLPVAGRFLLLGLHLLLVPLFAYHFRTGFRLRYDLLRNTFDYLFQPGVLHWVLFENGLAAPLFLAGGLLVVGALGFAGVGLPAPVGAEARPGRLLLALALYLPFLLLPSVPGDDLTLLVRGAIRYHTVPLPGPPAEAASRYPYVQGPPGPPRVRVGDASSPHVFILILESLNARYVESRTEKGEAFTPVLDALIPKGVYVERFYGNSVQTCRGQMAILCGILPSVRDREFVAHPDLSLRCLPSIFKDLGYTTVFMEGYHDLGFDNTGPFMKHLGFDEVRAMTDEFVTPEERAQVWGWGLQDDLLYRKVFGHLDRLRGAPEGGTGESRFFVTVMSATNHMWFDQVPEEKRLLFKDPKSLHERYANSVHLADLYLKEFFAQLEARSYLENSLVVVVGDHSFPTREQAGRGRALEEVSEETFRTPLLVLWPGRLAPRRIGALARSQVDIGPSLLDLLGIETRHHFVGTSIFNTALDRQPTVFLVQPYGGTSVAEVIGPMKYVKNLESGREFVYDLERDPEESMNLIRKMRGSGLLARFQEEMRKIQLNQRLLEEDRIWPRDALGFPGTR